MTCPEIHTSRSYSSNLGPKTPRPMGKPPTPGTSITAVSGGAIPAEEQEKSDKRPLRISKQRPKLPAPWPQRQFD